MGPYLYFLAGVIVGAAPAVLLVESLRPCATCGKRGSVRHVLVECQHGHMSTRRVG